MNAHLTTLNHKIACGRTDLDQQNIMIVLVKLTKLAKTLRLREEFAPQFNNAESYRKNTDKFYKKAYALAASIGCEFIGAPDIGEYLLRVNGLPERII